MELVGIIVAVVALVVGTLISVMKTSDEQLTWEGVRRYWHKLGDERRERRARKVYARRYMSPLHMRVGPLQRPRFGDRYRMGRLIKREPKVMAKLHEKHRLRGTPEFNRIAGEDLTVAVGDYAQRRWGAKLNSMWAQVRDEHPPQKS